MVLGALLFVARLSQREQRRGRREAQGGQGRRQGEQGARGGGERGHREQRAGNNVGLPQGKHFVFLWLLFSSVRVVNVVVLVVVAGGGCRCFVLGLSPRNVGAAVVLLLLTVSLTVPLVLLLSCC